MARTLRSGTLNWMTRNWGRQPATVVATFVVLSASFSLIAFMLTVSFNLKRVLTTWGEKVHLAVYLEDDLSTDSINKLRLTIEGRSEVSLVEYISKKSAADQFRDQMASYAPELLEDAEFSTPFPASFKVHLKEGQESDTQVQRLESLSTELKKLDGVEDVSYGQSWVKNYASVFKVISSGGVVFGLVLLFGSLFVIGNSIRASINQRRDEIEILELVGASTDSIRKPYVVEGFAMAGIASVVALVANFALFQWETSLMRASFAFARMATEVRFFNLIESLGFLLLASFVGGLGAWLTVRSLNDGWAAATRVRAAD